MKELKINGVIDSWQGWRLRNFLEENKGKDVRVRLNSYGGSIAVAVDMSHAMAEHGQVTIVHTSLNASAATWLTFGAKKIEMYSDCMLFVHPSSQEKFFWEQLDADGMKRLGAEVAADANALDKLDMMIAAKYASRSNGKLDAAGWLQKMKTTEWLTADECLDLGLVDVILRDKKAEKVNSAREQDFANCAIPMPDGYEVERSLVQQIVEGIKGFMSSAKVEPAPAINEEDTTNNCLIMNKKWTNVNALLNVEGVEVKDDKVVLTQEQMEAIENALKKNADDMEAIKGEKKTAQDNLQKVVNIMDSLSDEVKAKETAEDKAKLVKEKFDKIPAGVVVTTGTKTEDEKDDFEDCRVDPVNFFLDEE